ncbi:phage minor head protein [Micromonospora sp. NPDC049230]|uniref:phage minor head protein n=1 Tax=Micromonospora sp. NPDC049230 TaxID=3155502 RepID=UPI003403667C
MAVTRRTLWLLRALRADVGDQTDDTVRQLTAAWVNAWDVLDAEWRAAVDQVVALYAAGDRWPAPWQLARIDRLAAAQQQTAAALAALTTTTNTTIGAGATEVVAATATAEPVLMASQLPAAAAATAVHTYAARILPSALEAIAVRARSQIHSSTWSLTEDATQAMRRALISGVATGAHPTEAARSMVDQVEGAFNGGLARAMVIARTEMLDAYRDTSAAVHHANSAVLAGWTWISTLDGRTCPSCWAMHGTHHPLDERGPDDHQQGRCARMPRVKSWAEMGIPGVEGQDATPDAQKVFAALPRADQLSVMGPARLELLNSGQITWADLATSRDSQAWRRSYVPRPVRELQAIAARHQV